MAKRMKNDPAAASGDGGMDMTPMIDVTFQLIIFFMCVTDMTDATRERQLQLPVARKAEVDVVEPGRLLINVNKEGQVVISGQARTDADLRGIFKYEAYLSPKVDNLPNKAVYIRADRLADYRHVERVMALAQEQRLWRLMFSTADPAFAAAAAANRGG